MPAVQRQIAARQPLNHVSKARALLIALLLLSFTVPVHSVLAQDDSILRAEVSPEFTQTPLSTPSSTPSSTPYMTPTPTPTETPVWIPSPSPSPSPSLCENDSESPHDYDDKDYTIEEAKGSKEWNTTGNKLFQKMIVSPTIGVKIEEKEDGTEIVWNELREGTNGRYLNPDTDPIIAIDDSIKGIGLGDMVLVGFERPRKDHKVLAATTWVYAYVGKIGKSIQIGKVVAEKLKYPGTLPKSFEKRLKLIFFPDTGAKYCLIPEGNFADFNTVQEYGKEVHEARHAPAILEMRLPKERSNYIPITKSELKLYSAFSNVVTGSTWVSKENKALGLTASKVKVDADGSHFGYVSKAQVIKKIKYVRHRYSLKDPEDPTKTILNRAILQDIFRKYNGGKIDDILKGILNTNGVEYKRWLSSGNSQQSTTSLGWRDKADQLSGRRYPNADTVPYMVIPSDWFYKKGEVTRTLAYPGDLGLMCKTHNGERRCLYVLIADGGPSTKFGEAAVFTAEYLRFYLQGPNHGEGKDVEFVIFPGTHTQVPGCTTHARLNGWNRNGIQCNLQTAEQIQALGRSVCTDALGDAQRCPSPTFDEHTYGGDTSETPPPTPTPSATPIPPSTPKPTPDPQVDSDGDGAPDQQDNCPAIPNGKQADRDNDGVGDACDNCRTRANSDQSDLDKDGKGDLCDRCGNGIVEKKEKCDPGIAAGAPGGHPSCSQKCKLPKNAGKNYPGWSRALKRAGNFKLNSKGGSHLLTPQRKGALRKGVGVQELERYNADGYTIRCLGIDETSEPKHKERSKIREVSGALVTAPDGRQIVSGQFIEQRGKKKTRSYAFHTSSSAKNVLKIEQLVRMKNGKVPAAEPKEVDLLSMQSRLLQSTAEDRNLDRAIRSAHPSSTAALRDNACGETIDVLVGYTAGALTQNGGDALSMVADISSAVCQAGQYMRNSGIEPVFRLAGTIKVPDNSSGSAVTDLQALSNFQDGWNDSLLDAMLNTEADMLALIVEDGREWGKQWCGNAWIMQEASLGFATTKNFGPYSVSSLWCIKNTETLTHELGHNLGMHHYSEIANEGSSGLFDDSYGWKWNGHRSIMAHPPGKRANLFSNPSLGAGAPGVADNARTANVSAPIASCFSDAR